MPRIAAQPATPAKLVGERLDLHDWLNAGTPVKNPKGKVIGTQWANVSEDVHQDLNAAKEEKDDDDRVVRLVGRNVIAEIALARRQFGPSKELHEMEFVLLKPLTLEGCGMLVNGGKEDGIDEPSITKYFAQGWVATQRNNANARLSTQVEGLDRRTENAIKTLMIARGISYQKAAQMWAKMVELEEEEETV